MKRIFTASLFLFFAFSGSSLFAQVSKGNWIVGGSGSLDLSKTELGNGSNYTSSSKKRSFGLSPYVGYFPLNQLAVGIRTNFERNKYINEGSNSFVSKVLEAGPFARYYFLPTGSKVNLLTEGSFQYGHRWGNQDFRLRTYSLSAGSVFFLNQHVGVEMLMGYYNRKETLAPNESSNFRTSGLKMSLGVQVHLGKAKK